MNRILLSLSSLLLSALTLRAAEPAPKWDIDADHTTVGFTVNHFFTPVAGTFNEVKGTIRFDPANVEGSSFDVTIPVTSVDTRNSKRDKHLQSSDFFNAKSWSQMRFVSSGVEKTGENTFNLKGKLTIRDQTRDVTLPLELLGLDKVKMNLIGSTTVAGLRIRTSLNRNDYGVGTGSWAATAVVGDKVELDILMELHR